MKGFKRVTALLLSVLMVVSLITVAMFTQATADTYNQVVDAGGTETFENGYLELTKTIECTGENAFDVTLKVATKSTSISTTPVRADVVLVIDATGSMKGDRYENAKSAALLFAQTLFGWTSTNTAPAANGNRIAIVTYSDKVIVNNGFKNNYTDTVIEINKLTAQGSTNIQAGLAAGTALLSSSTSATKVMLLLSDGEPNASYKATAVANANVIPKYAGGYYNTRVTSFSTAAKDIRYYVKAEGQGYSKDCIWYLGNDGWLHYIADDTNDEIVLNTLSQAYIAKTTTGAKIYSVLISDETTTTGSKADFIMKNIATDASCYTNVDDLDDLAEVFTKVAESTVIAASGTSVTDTMGPYIDFVKVAGDSNNGATCADDVLSWDLSKAASTVKDGVTTYTLKYSVTLDTDADGFKPNTATPANASASLAYTFDGTAKTAYFKVPTVQGKLPTYNYEFNFYKKAAGASDYVLQTETVKGSAEKNSAVAFPSGYAAKYAAQRYTFTTADSADVAVNVSGAKFTLSKNNAVVNLYYDEDAKADYTVTHVHTEVVTTTTISGTTTSSSVTSSGYDGNGYVGDDVSAPYSMVNSKETVTGATFNSGSVATGTDGVGFEITSGSNDLVINYLLETENDLRTPTDVVVKHVYKTVDGSGNVIAKYETEDAALNHQAAFETKTNGDPLYVGESFTATVDTDTHGYTCKTATSALTVTLDEKGKTVITIEYTRVFKATTVTVNHIYKTVDDKGNEVEIIALNHSETYPATGDAALYENDIFTATPDSPAKGDGFTCITTGDALKLKLKAADNVINIYYTKSLQSTNVVVHHVYTTVDELGNVIAKYSTDDTAYTRDDTISADAEGKLLYKDDSFTATPDADTHGYTLTTAASALTITLKATGNSVTINYVRTINSTEVTVNHIYKTVDEDGNVIAKYSTADTDLSHSDKFPTTGKLYEGESFTATVDNPIKGEGYVRTTADTALTITLGAKADNVIDIVYTRTLNSTEVTVNHIYKTVDEKGNVIAGYSAADALLNHTESYPQIGDATLYEGESFTAPADNPVKGVGYARTTADTALTITLGAKADNVIDVVYTRTLNSTTATVNHTYKTLDEDGNVIAAYSTVDTALNHSESFPTTGKLYEGESFTATPDTDTNGYTMKTGTVLTITLKADSASNVVNIIYTRTLNSTKVTVNHTYKTLDEEGNVIAKYSTADTALNHSDKFPTTGKLYESESFTATVDTDTHGYTCKTAAAALTITLKADSAHNVIDVLYTRTLIATGVTVNHIYKTVDDKGNEVVTTLGHSESFPTGSDTLYVGEVFTATPDSPVKGDGYTCITSGDALQLELKVSDNVINIYYTKDLQSTSVIVHHVYTTVDELGNVIAKYATDDTANTHDSTISTYGEGKLLYAGESFTATPDTDTHGYTRTTADTALTITLKATDNSVTINYVRTINSTEVTVKHIYKTFDESGVQITKFGTEDSSFEHSETITVDANGNTLYEGESFTATPDSDTHGYTLVTADADLTITLGAKGGNTITIDYSRILKATSVTVNHIYETVDTDGNLIEVTDLSHSDKFPATGGATLYEGESFTAEIDNPIKGEDYTCKTASAALTITLKATAADNVIDIHYTKTLNATDVTVKHIYQTVDQNGNPIAKYATADTDNSHQETISKKTDGKPYYVGDSFTATPDTDTHGYTMKAGTVLTKVLADSENCIEIIYTRVVNTTDVTVNHVYNVFVDGVDKGDTDKLNHTDKVTVNGNDPLCAGDSYTAAADANAGYTRTTADADLTITLGASGNVITVNYVKRTITPPVSSETSSVASSEPSSVAGSSQTSSVISSYTISLPSTPTTSITEIPSENTPLDDLPNTGIGADMIVCLIACGAAALGTIPFFAKKRDDEDK